MFNKFTIQFNEFDTQSKKTQHIHQIFNLISFRIRKNKSLKIFFNRRDILFAFKTIFNNQLCMFILNCIARFIIS